MSNFGGLDANAVSFFTVVTYARSEISYPGSLRVYTKENLQCPSGKLSYDVKIMSKIVS